MRLQQPIDSGLRHEVALGVDEPHRQLPGAQFGLLQRQSDDLGPDIVRDAVPDAAWLRWPVFQGFGTAGLILLIPAIEGGTWHADLFQRLADRQMRLRDDPDDFGLLGAGVSHASASPSPSM